MAATNGGWFSLIAAVPRALAILCITCCLGLFPTALEAAQTYTWVPGGSGVWTSPLNWTPVRNVPASDDVLVFSSSGSTSVIDVPNQTIGQMTVTNSTTVNLSGQTGSRVLTIAGASGPDLVVAAGSVLNVITSGSNTTLLLASGASGNVSGTISLQFSDNRLAAADSGAIVFESGSLFESRQSGRAFGTGPGPEPIAVFASGSTFELHPGSGPPTDKVAFQPGSLYRHKSGAELDFSEEYADFEYEGGTSSEHASPGFGVDNLTIKAGSLEVTNDDPNWLEGDLAILSGTMNIRLAEHFEFKGNLTVLAPGTLRVSQSGFSEGLFMFAGTSAQSIQVLGSLEEFGSVRFEVDNPSGVFLESDLTLASITLAFSNGRLITGPQTLTIGALATITGAGPTQGWVAGRLQRQVPLSGLRTYEIGSDTDYLPVTVQVNGLSAPFDLAVSTHTPDHPDLGASLLDTLRSVNRYWTLTPEGSPSFSGFDVTFRFAPGDLDGSASTSSFRMIRRASSAWSVLDVGARTATSTQAIGVTGYGDFAIANGSITYNWVGGPSAAWGAAASWNPPRWDPGSDDILVFAGGDSSSVTNLQGQTARQLWITNGTRVGFLSGAGSLNLVGADGEGLRVGSGSRLSISTSSPLGFYLATGAVAVIDGTLIFSNSQHWIDGSTQGSITFRSGSHCVQASRGHLFTSGGVTNAVAFLAGSVFEMKGDIQSNVPLSTKVVFHPGSLYRHLNSALAPELVNRTYGDFEFGTSGMVSVYGGGTANLQNLTVSQGTVTLAMTGAVHVTGNLTIAAGAKLKGGTSPLTIRLSGTSPQMVTASGSLEMGVNTTLSIDNPSNVALGANLTLNSGAIDFVSGRLITGDYVVSAVGTTSITGAGPSTGWIAGNLQRRASGATLLTFPIGGTNTYRPFTVQFAGLTAPFNLRASTLGTDHPEIATSCIDTEKAVQRHWALVPSTNPVFTTCTLTLGFSGSELDPGANPLAFGAGAHDGASWSLLAVGARTPTSTECNLTSLSGGRTLAVGEAPPPTMITTHPASQTVALGTPVSFSVAASGSGLTYQWRRLKVPLVDGAGISGATSGQLQIAAAGGTQGGSYDVVITDLCGQFQSNTATLTVTCAPARAIIEQPEDATAGPGQPASFSVLATGCYFVRYQWRRDDVPIPGATGSTYSIAAVTEGDAGTYSVAVTDTMGTTISAKANLNLTDPVLISFTSGPPSSTVNRITWKFRSSVNPWVDYGGTSRLNYTFTDLLPGAAGAYELPQGGREKLFFLLNARDPVTQNVRVVGTPFAETAAPTAIEVVFPSGGPIIQVESRRPTWLSSDPQLSLDFIVKNIGPIPTPYPARIKSVWLGSAEGRNQSSGVILPLCVTMGTVSQKVWFARSQVGVPSGQDAILKGTVEWCETMVPCTPTNWPPPNTKCHLIDFTARHAIP